jgi:hypothetical protein
MPTVQQLLNDVRVRLPHSTATFTDGVVIGWMDDVQSEVWRYMASTELYEFDTVASQALYSIPSDCRFDKILSVQVSESTTIDGTEGYTAYEYAGPDDELTGTHWYQALDNIGIYPVPTSDGAGYNVKLTYEAAPTALSTDTLTVVPDINVEYQDILKFRALRNMASAGDHPDVDLANNYQRDEDAILRRIRIDYMKRKAKVPKKRWDYKRGWWKG